ncbi:hypothetical protein [Acinetobacter baumannii]
MDKKALLEQFKAEVEASGTSLAHILKMCVFDEVSNDFRSEEVHDYSVGCLNGAWWMYQRQQAKVEELQKRMDAAIELMQKPVIVGEPAKYVCARFKEIEQALKGEG